MKQSMRMSKGGWPQELNIEDQLSGSPPRPSGVHSPDRINNSTRYLGIGSHKGTSVASSMDLRHKQMRSEVKLRDQNTMLAEKVSVQQDEIKQLRQYLRDMFDQ